MFFFYLKVFQANACPGGSAFSFFSSVLFHPCKWKINTTTNTITTTAYKKH